MDHHGECWSDHYDDAQEYCELRQRRAHHDRRGETQEGFYMGGRGHGHSHHDYEDDEIGKFKIYHTIIQWETEPDDYLEWEIRVGQIFDSHHYTEQKKVRYDLVEPTMSCWRSSRCMGAIEESDSEMLYSRTLHKNLVQSNAMIHTRNCSVDEYYKETEILMISTWVNEQQEATILSFFHGQ